MAKIGVHFWVQMPSISSECTPTINGHGEEKICQEIHSEEN